MVSFLRKEIEKQTVCSRESCHRMVLPGGGGGGSSGSKPAHPGHSSMSPSPVIERKVVFFIAGAKGSKHLLVLHRLCVDGMVTCRECPEEGIFGSCFGLGILWGAGPLGAC